MHTPTGARRRARKALGERGASAVEFALIVPILLTLVFGIAEFGRAYYIQTSLTNAAREGARAAALTSGTSTAPSSAAVAAVKAASTLTLADSQITVNQVASTGGTLNGNFPCQSGSTLVVSASYPMVFLTSLFGTNVTLSGKASMRCGG